MRSFLPPLASAPLLVALLLSGCHRPDPGSVVTSISFGGRARSFVLHVPSSAPAPGARRLIISLHGRGGSGLQQEDLTGLSTLAERDGFIAIYPDGVDKSWADGRGASSAEKQGIDDVGFLGALIDWAVSNHGADPKRVHVSGHSNGGMMASRLGCDLSAKVASISPVAAELPELLSKSCAPIHPMSVMTFHGTDDAYVPYDGGTLQKGAGGVILGAKAARAFWAEKAGCAPDPVLTAEPDRDPDDGTTVIREESKGCAQGAEVLLFTIQGGGHTWPGGDADLGERVVGKVSRELDASELQVTFFTKHPMP